MDMNNFNGIDYTIKSYFFALNLSITGNAVLTKTTTQNINESDLLRKLIGR